ncbi:altered inheritance of mitochondria protein 21 [Thrips palmi]|uniref:Altered inheritance of mitochondria protein 21 n=1 Tax=Thrips palmi TaxID=161013 RepID=A0A6P9ABA6_THRPL|nr:altered inheritance of mitochondria protein 21 [Thrips palmi]XP_034253272.1 altered inheritance of mitochondria protein 21 [Thrips palmi]
MRSKCQSMANFCTWCSNHGFSIIYNYKHKLICKYFRCTCSKCEGTITYLRNVAIQRVSQQKQAAEREKFAKRQREIERQKTAKRKKDAKQQNFPANQNAVEKKRISRNEKSSWQNSSVRTQSIPSTSRDQSSPPYCKFCRNHGLSYYFIGQHYKCCKYWTCSCRKCQDIRGPAKSRATKAAEGSKKRSRKERSESPEGSSKRLCVENVDQPLPNCPLCLNHGFSFPLKAHHISVCLHKNCSCDPCRDERKSMKEKVTQVEEKEDNKSEERENNKSEGKENIKSEDKESNKFKDKENIKSLEEKNHKSDDKENIKSTEQKNCKSEDQENIKSTEEKNNKSDDRENIKSTEQKTNKSEDQENIKSTEEQNIKSEDKEKNSIAVNSVHSVTAPTAPTDMRKPCAVVAPKPRLCTASFSSSSSSKAYNYQENKDENLPKKNVDVQTLSTADSTAPEGNLGAEKTASPEEGTAEKNKSENIADARSKSPEVNEDQRINNSPLHEEETTSEGGAPELIPDVESELAEVSEIRLSQGTSNSSVYSETVGMPEILDEEYHTVSEISESSNDEGSNLSADGEETSTKVTEAMGMMSNEGGDMVIEPNIVSQASNTLSVKNSAQDSSCPDKCKDHVEDQVVEEEPSKSDSIVSNIGKVGEGSEEESNGSQAIISKSTEDLSNNSLESEATPIPFAETGLSDPRPEMAIEGDSTSMEARKGYDRDSCNEGTNAIETTPCVPMSPTHSAPRHISNEDNMSSKLFSEVSEINGSSNVARDTNSLSFNSLENKDCEEKAGYQESCSHQETTMDASKNSTLTSCPEKKAPDDMADLMAKLATLGKNLQSALPLSRSLSVPASLERSLFDESQPFDLSSHLQKSLSNSRHQGTPSNTIQPGSELVQENGSEGIPIVSTPACAEMRPEKPKETPQEGAESLENLTENVQENPEFYQKPRENSQEDPDLCSKETDSSVTPPALHLVEDATLPQESTNAEEVTISPAELPSGNVEVNLQKECDGCHKVFSASTNFRIHQYLKHDVDCESNPGTMYQCRECPYENEKEIATLDHESSHMSLVPLDRMLKLFCVISNEYKRT